MLEILTLHDTTPDIRSYNAIFFENLLSILKTKTKVHTTWIAITPDKLNLSPSVESGITTLDIHDYKNAVEIIQKVKPDIIYVLPGLSVPDYALALAGKFFKIPVVGPIFGTPFFSIAGITKVTKSWITQFFQSSVPTDTNEKQKRFMKRGRFFIYKLLFLLRTQQAIKMSRFQILENFFMLFRVYFRLTQHYDIEYSKFACTLHFVESEKRIEPLVKAGFERSSIVVTGNPTYDIAFQKIQKFKPHTKNDGKIQVLLLTTNLWGAYGRWTRERRDAAVKGIVTEICNHKDEMSLIVKIHPSGEILSEYQSLINPIDPSIPVYQKGDVMDFLETSDVVISLSSNTTLVLALITRKPIIIYNVFDIKGDLFLGNGVALECTDISKLVPSIQQILSSNPASEKKVENFIHEYLYKSDGRATERIGNAILELIEKKQY